MYKKSIEPNEHVVTIKFVVDKSLSADQLHELLCVTIHEQGGPTAELEEQKQYVFDIIGHDEPRFNEV